MENIFPDSYPTDLLERIIEDGAGNNLFEKVFRVATSGSINRDTFLSTFEESNVDKTTLVNRDLYLQQKNIYDIGDYSVSFYEKRRDAKRILRLKKRYYDGPVLITGSILPIHGMSIRTQESNNLERRTTDSHIDLWKYRDADLTELFELDVEEVK